MFRLHQFLWLAAVAAAACHAMPMGCTEDTHCPSGFFCDPSRLFCHQCISCELLKRRPPAVGSSCLTKVEECGACFKGLVQRSEGLECIPPPRSAPLELPPYAWALIALGLMVLGLMVTLAAGYVLRNFHTFKILACSTRTSVHTPQEQSPVVATAPPPYHAVMGTELPTPDSMALEEACPFIAPVPVPGRQSASRQGARVFSPPDYSQDHDQHDSGVDGAGELAAHVPALAELQEYSVDTTMCEARGAKEMELTVAKPQNGNNNNEEQDRSRTHDRQSDRPTFIAHSTSPVIINVIKNIHGNHHDSSTH